MTLTAMNATNIHDRSRMNRILAASLEKRIMRLLSKNHPQEKMRPTAYDHHFQEL